MNKSPLLLAGPLDTNSPFKVSFKDESIDHRIDAIGGIVTIDITGTDHVYLHLVAQAQYLFLTSQLSNTIVRAWVRCTFLVDGLLRISVDRNTTDVYEMLNSLLLGCVGHLGCSPMVDLVKTVGVHVREGGGNFRGQMIDHLYLLQELIEFTPIQNITVYKTQGLLRKLLMIKECIGTTG